VLERAAALADEPELVGHALKILARVAKHRDRLADAADLLDRAVEVLRSASARPLLAGVLIERAAVAMRCGFPEQAERIYDEAAATFDELGREANARVCDVNKALSRIQRGEIEGNAARLERAFRTFQLGGFVSQAVLTGCHLAHLHYSMGDLAAAFAALAESRELSGQVNHQSAHIELNTTHMALLLAQGRLAAARQHADSARAALGRSGKTDVEVALDCFDAQWRVLSGGTGADEAALRAIAAARKSEAARTRAYPAGELVQFVPLGLDPSVFPEDETDERLAALYAGARAFADESGSPEDLDRALAASLIAPQPWRHAEWMVHRAALSAEAHARRGEPQQPSLVEGLEAATRLGHVWWQAYFLRRLAALDASQDYPERLDALVFRIADHCDDPSEKRRIVQQWSAG